MKQSSTTDRSVAINRIIFVLSIIGVIIALYVTQSFLRKTGIVCVNSGCELVRKSSASYLFGTIPVPSVGLLGYTALAILAFLKTSTDKRWIINAMLGIALFGVCFVTWFTYTELFVIKGVCTWCAISAVNMYGILGLVLAMRQKKPSVS